LTFYRTLSYEYKLIKKQIKSYWPDGQAVFCIIGQPLNNLTPY